MRSAQGATVHAVPIGMIQPKFKEGMAVQVLKMRDGSPKWVDGYVFKRCVDDQSVRVKQVAEGPGHGHVTTWSHDRVRPALTR